MARSGREKQNKTTTSKNRINRSGLEPESLAPKASVVSVGPSADFVVDKSVVVDHEARQNRKKDRQTN